MRSRPAWLAVLSTVVLLTAAATDGGALLNRKHVGRVKSVNPSEGRLVVEGMFHDRSLREIPVTLAADAPIINPDLMDRTRAVTRREIRPGHYVVLECEETGGRHVARKVTITSTEEEEQAQRALSRARRAPRPRLRGTGGDLD